MTRKERKQAARCLKRAEAALAGAHLDLDKADTFIASCAAEGPARDEAIFWRSQMLEQMAIMNKSLVVLRQRVSVARDG